MFQCINHVCKAYLNIFKFYRLYEFITSFDVEKDIVVTKENVNIICPLVILALIIFI
uniref:Uncharacterized protein n=1 Tax=Heterorhabditis bacteriophora TaxID=37862 RepID=A0A1I7WXZ1_HETBA